MKKNKHLRIFLISILTLVLTLIPYYANAATTGISIEPIILNGSCGTTNYYIKFQNIPEEQLKNVKVTIADKSIADVELSQITKTIFIKQKKIGKTTITAKLTYEGKTYTDSQEINTIDPADCYHTHITGSNNVKTGETIQLTLEYNVGSTAYSKVSAGPNLSWTSSKTTIATVNSAGQVTGISAGTTTITATYKISEEIIKEATYNITVTPSNTPSNNNTNTNTHANNPQNNNQQEETITENNTTNEKSEASTKPDNEIKNNETLQDNPTTIERIKSYLKEYEFLIKIIGILLLICLILKTIQANIKSTK